MTTPNDKTIRASFKGIDFFVHTESKESGRKVAIHEYPGSDVRLVEDLGELPDIFRIDGFVEGNNWQSQFRRLETALKSKTEGILELTSFGIVKVKAESYNASQSQRSVGEITFNITFLITTNRPSPVISPDSVQTTSTKAGDVLIEREDGFSDEYVEPVGAESVISAEYEGEQVADDVVDISRRINSEVTGIINTANRIKSEIAKLVHDPDSYSENIFNSGLLGELFDLLPLDGTSLSIILDLTKFGNNLATDFFSIKSGSTIMPASDYDIPLFDETTVSRINRNNNRKALVNGVRICGLAMYCDQAARSEFQTDSDINNAKANINTAYNAIVLTDDVNARAGSFLDKCRLSSLNVLDQKLQLTPNIEPFTTP
ncbi:DNA circularization N-terminal domain-containing protein, partial [Candidatus Pacearchaeota archaeon]|nr:DNA circularization N-terminal domain-containing protein [Candidatus Pacearchaeota archaeon]